MLSPAAAERAAGVRVIVENEHGTAFTPAVARWPFEVLVAPRRVMAAVTGLTESEAAAFAPVYLDVRKRLDALFGVEMPYITAWRLAPYLAGSESAMGAFVNDIVPEQAARMLREAA
jgi:UDPglucose--hexose-1-phosphate uridylyltransferase